MIDVHIHYRGLDSERRKLPAVPETGSYIYGPDGRLFRVGVVVFEGTAVEIYAVQVSPGLAGELTTAWATWGVPG